MYSVSILLCLFLFLFHASIEETTTMTSVGDRHQVLILKSQIKDQGNKIAKLTALVVKRESEIAKITHSQEATMTAAATTSAATLATATPSTPSTQSTTATTASTTAAPSTTTSAATSTRATPPMTAASTTSAATMGALSVGVADQALLLHIKDQDIKIAELKALLEHQISEVKIQVEHQNTKFSAENVKFAKVETKFYILESEIKRLTHSQTATTSSPQTTTSSPQTTTSSPQTTTSSTVDASSGVVFTRWGRRDCPAGISTPVYNGTVGGSNDGDTGAAVNHLCMPNDPTWDVNKIYKSTYVGYVYGGNYYSLPDSSFNDHVPLCAVCRAVSFSTKVVIPGRNTCYLGWTKAYDGELTSGYHGNNAATEYTCLDRQPQKVVQSGAHGSGAGVWLRPVLAKCGALPCPPYQDEALLTCVVCLK